ncbi:hypothetical protein H0H93_010958 [Arthromyces matolae]|nr:hypothetical protein H0H93_010958 [Arthromyces matolae]
MTSVLPTEVYQEIFEYACTDHGKTGPSLALVSRHFRETSRRYQFQSVAIQGVKQLHSFARYLSGLPPNSCRVRFLCISVVLDSLPKTTKYRHLMEDGMLDFWEHEKTISDDLLQVLYHVSWSLTTLHLISNLRRTSLLPSIPIPFLRSLTIHGPLRPMTHAIEDLPLFPHLTHLSLRLIQGYPPTALRCISKQAPSLRSLSFSMDRPLPELSRDLTRTLKLDSHTSLGLAIPASITHIHIRHVVGPAIDDNIWLKNAQKAMLRELGSVVEKDRRITIEGVAHLLSCSDEEHDRFISSVLI